MGVCKMCSRPVRRQSDPAAAHPGSVLIAAGGTCWACYRARQKGLATPAVNPVEERTVYVKTYLRPSTFRQLLGHATNRGMTVAELLSVLADASLHPVKGKKP